MWQSCLGCHSCMGWPWIPASTGWFGYLYNWSKTWFLWRECSNILTYPMRLPLLLKTGSLAKTGHSKAVSLFKLAACVLNLPSPHHQLLMSTFRTRLVFMLCWFFVWWLRLQFQLRYCADSPLVLKGLAFSQRRAEVQSCLIYWKWKYISHSSAFQDSWTNWWLYPHWWHQHNNNWLEWSAFQTQHCSSEPLFLMVLWGLTLTHWGSTMMQLYGRFFSIFICDFVLEDWLLLSANVLNFPVLLHKSLIQSIVGASVSSALNLLLSLVWCVELSNSGREWGQWQLFCLGCVLLKSSHILVLDETTASINRQTDVILQRIIKTKFGNCTIISIAHRIPSVMDTTKSLSWMLVSFIHPH
jgi:hypothetical protein